MNNKAMKRFSLKISKNRASITKKSKKLSKTVILYWKYSMQEILSHADVSIFKEKYWANLTKKLY